MAILKIRDWLLVKSGIQFKSNLTRGFTRIVDGVDFYSKEPMVYINNGEWVFTIDRFSSDMVHVDCHIRRPDSIYVNNFRCEINDIKIVHSGSKFLIYSYIDRTSRSKPRRRIVAKKN